MLQKLSSEIRECYRHAEECRHRADASADPSTRDDFLAMEKRWLYLAHSYEFAEQLSSFTAASRTKQAKP